MLLAENPVGTEACPPVLFASVAIGMMRSAWGAALWAGLAAKKVASSVAVYIVVNQLGAYTGLGKCALAYSPFRPVWIRLSSWRMKGPGFANSGMKRVTSLRYVQMMPSPLVGSGVDVLQTSSEVSLGSGSDG